MGILFHTTQEAARVLLSNGPRRISPFAIPMLMSNGAAGLVSIDYGFRGPSFGVASACASGADAIGMAWLMLRAGVVDVAVTGASESTITEAPAIPVTGVFGHPGLHTSWT